MISSLCEPVFGTMTQKLKINTKQLWFRLFQMVRTFVIVLLGYIFDIAPNLTESFSTFYRLFTQRSFSTAWRQIRELELDVRHYQIIFLGTLLMLLVDVYHETNGCGTIRKTLDEKPFLLRYILLLGCLLATLYFGVWGPSFGAAAFVYMQF